MDPYGVFLNMNASTYPNTQTHLEEVAATLKKGGVAVFPTDTVYDLGCSIKHPEAIQRIFKMKSRPNVTWVESPLNICPPSKAPSNHAPERSPPILFAA